MNFARTFAEIVYPESDGKPIAETEMHFEWMIDIRSRLKYRYRKQRVYVCGGMFVYYAESDPRQSVVPDVFVVKDCDPAMRRTFKMWEEQRTLDVVFEVTSDSTRREDEQYKPETYAYIGVKELFLYDPTGDYLDPPLQGYRFARGRTTRIRPDASGALECCELGIRLRQDDGHLRMFDAETGKRLLSPEEAAHAEREAAEEELRKLREQLGRERGDASQLRALGCWSTVIPRRPVQRDGRRTGRELCVRLRQGTVSELVWRLLPPCGSRHAIPRQFDWFGAVALECGRFAAKFGSE